MMMMMMILMVMMMTVHSYISWILRDHLFEVTPVRVVVNAFCLLEKFLEALLCSFSLLILLLLFLLLQFRNIVVEVGFPVPALLNCLEPLILGLFSRELRPAAFCRHPHLFAKFNKVLLPFLCLCFLLLPLLICTLSDIF